MKDVDWVGVVGGFDGLDELFEHVCVEDGAVLGDDLLDEVEETD